MDSTEIHRILGNLEASAKSTEVWLHQISDEQRALHARLTDDKREAIKRAEKDRKDADKRLVWLEKRIFLGEMLALAFGALLLASVNGIAVPFLGG